MSDRTYARLSFDALDGWAADDHSAALEVFLVTCGDVKSSGWGHLAKLAAKSDHPRNFFEQAFAPVLIEDGGPMLFTGYFEPELQGSRVRTDAFSCPVYALPDDLVPGVPYLSRKQIEEDQALSDSGLELVWLRDSVDLFFLQVQGSGRIRFPDASMIRLGYAGKNGREYSSLGQTLIARGIFTAQNVSADAIRDWLRANPKEGREEMWTNESYVFFRELTDVPSEKGPLGAMGRSITAGRSIAVDPAFVELGAPVWIEKDGPNPIKRLMIAQDTGSAIKGAQRADVFFGTGEGAGHAASAVNDGGRMVTLLPIALAEQLTKGKS